MCERQNISDDNSNENDNTGVFDTPRHLQLKSLHENGQKKFAVLFFFSDGFLITTVVLAVIAALSIALNVAAAIFIKRTLLGKTVGSKTKI